MIIVIYAVYMVIKSDNNLTETLEKKWKVHVSDMLEEKKI